MKPRMIGLVLALASLGGAVAAMPLSGPFHPAAKTGRTGWLVDANEARLSIFGGYRGERPTKARLKPHREIDGVVIYRMAGRNGRYYADRDRDGRIDTGIIYVPSTLMVLIDWNCDGSGDRILTDLSPPDPRPLSQILDEATRRTSVRTHNP